MPDQFRRYLGVQRIPLVEYIRLYEGQAGWTAAFDGTTILRIETINPQWYRLYLADGRVRKVGYAAKLTVSSNEEPADGIEQ